MTAPLPIELRVDDYRLVLEPGRGGSIARFDWRGEPLFRPTCGTGILDVACFALVPFSNRIAHGTFYDGRNMARLTPNFPGGGHPHPLHGFGWLSAWDVVENSAGTATLRHDYSPGEWPWAYQAEQEFHLDAKGLRHGLTISNLSDERMPAGLGFHPYFPKTPHTRYSGRHSGEWQVNDEGLPLSLQQTDGPVDWWRGQPVATRTVDTVYAGRKGDLGIVWPDRNLALTIAPSHNLPCTVVYSPQDADYFCVEPVSHATDAINHPERPDAMTWLSPGETLTVAVRYVASFCSTGHLIG